MEDANSWLRRTKFSQTCYHRMDWIRYPNPNIDALGVDLPRAHSTSEREESSTPTHRRRSLDFPRKSSHGPARAVVQWNPLTNMHRSVSPTPELKVSDTFKEARMDLKRFSTPQRTESDRGLVGKLFHKDAGDGKGHPGKHSPEYSPRGSLRTRRGSDKKLRKELVWSKMFDHGGGKVTGVEAMDEHMADMCQLLIGHRFAHGAHSRLHHGIYKDEAVAVKIITVPDDDDNGSLAVLLEKQFDREVSCLSRLKHPNIIKSVNGFDVIVTGTNEQKAFRLMNGGQLTFGSVSSSNFVAAWKKPPVYGIIAEYLSQGSLRTYLHKLEHRVLPLQKIVEYSLEIALGMEYVHSHGIIHRDLKPENILIDEELHMKIADFGTACEEAHVDHFDDDPGTYRWMAPEMIKHKPYGRKVDVYSFGLILWEMISGSIPYEDMTPVQAAFAVNLRPEFSTNCPPAMQALIEHCWSTHSEKRPEFSQIVKILDQFESSLAHDGTLPLVLDTTWLDDHKKNRSHRIQMHDHLANFSSMPKPRFI
ncbi:Serine/threonine/tyrosine-protein kinase HT1-like protein [Drosera capensis]